MVCLYWVYINKRENSQTNYLFWDRGSITTMIIDHALNVQQRSLLVFTNIQHFSTLHTSMNISLHNNTP
jgi:hypothetical protein